jgi:formylglycine-generating enzyme required for sulfatase activity
LRLNEIDERYTYRLPTEEEWSHAAGDVEGYTYAHCNSRATIKVGFGV